MKRVTVKQQLVDYMIASGNKGFTYTEVIKTVLRIKFGSSFKYDSSYRGYYSCAISGLNNYFMNGAGKFGLMKIEGKYYAKYFNKYDRMWRARKLMLQNIDHVVGRSSHYPHTREQFITEKVNALTARYLRSIKRIEKETASEPSGY
jgi:hypothetical protein